MSTALRQRARIARVRRLQHGLAASSAVKAADQLRQLEANSDRLAQMRGELQIEAGATTGAALAQAGELAMRLDNARHGLRTSIEDARAAAHAREASRLAARRDQESAERLEQAAAGAAERMAERQARGLALRRRRFGIDQGTSS